MVLDRMLANEFITEEQHEAAVQSMPPRLEEYSARLETRYPAGHFVEEVRRWFLDNPAFGASRGVRERLLFEGGLRIETTVDLDLQAAAEQSVEDHLPANQGHPDAAVVVLETGTGQVLAMVGGRDFFDTDEDAKVNLAVGVGRTGRLLDEDRRPGRRSGGRLAGHGHLHRHPTSWSSRSRGRRGQQGLAGHWGVGGHDATEARFEHGLQALLQFSDGRTTPTFQPTT